MLKRPATDITTFCTAFMLSSHGSSIFSVSTTQLGSKLHTTITAHSEEFSLFQRLDISYLFDKISRAKSYLLLSLKIPHSLCRMCSVPLAQVCSNPTKFKENGYSFSFHLEVNSITHTMLKYSALISSIVRDRIIIENNVICDGEFLLAPPNPPQGNSAYLAPSPAGVAPPGPRNIGHF